MSKKTKKAMSMLLVVALIAVIAIGGMLAYLTDRDSEANVFTVGDVAIDLTEDFQQGAELVPGKDVTKEVKVVNTGKNDAYVWAMIAVPSKLDNTENASHNALHFNYSSDDAYNWAWQDKNGQWMYQEEVEIAGETVNYNVYSVLYKDILKAGETTEYAAMTKVYLDNHLDIAPNGDWYHVENGVAEGPFWNVENDGTPIIYVSAYAMQVEEFEDVYAAYEAYNKQWTTTEGINNGLEWGTPGTLVSNANELVKALENNEDVIFTDDIKIDPANMSNAYGATGINVKNGQSIHGNGKTLDIKGAGGTWDSGINTTGGLIKDLTVTGSFRGIFINHNSTYSEPVVLENVTIDGTTYTISCDQGMNQNFTARNSTFKGWTSYAATIGTAEFVDCNFGEGNGYAYCRPYAPTEFVGCEFEAGFAMDPRAAVTFENCTIGGVALTAENLATLVTSNIANATVK